METMSPDSTTAYDHLLKILLVGDTNSNKRALLGAYLEDLELEQKNTSTLGLDYKLKDVRYKGKVIKLQLWDTAGQERFRSVTASYYRGAHGALLCFPMEREPSFVTLNYWLDEMKDSAPVNFQVVLVAIETGNENEEFNMEMIRQYAHEKGLTLVTCNVGDKVKVQQVFHTVVEQIMTSLEEDNMAEDSVRLHNYTRDPHNTQSKCLC